VSCDEEGPLNESLLELTIIGLGAYMLRVCESRGLLCGVDMIGALPSVLR
jgi:hypothetical protein